MLDRAHEAAGRELCVDERAVDQRDAAAAERELERERERVTTTLASGA